MDNAEVDHLPFTLADLTIFREASSISGQKRGGARLDDDEAADTGTSSGVVQNPVPPDRHKSVYTAPPIQCQRWRPPYPGRR
jgi:hypothetical protein